MTLGPRLASDGGQVVTWLYSEPVPLRLSRTGYRRVARLAQGALVGIVLTGSWVRLTGSGLGCSDWPECNEERFVDVSSWHAAIEQVNRLLTGVVAVAVVLAALGAYLVRPTTRSIKVLAGLLVVGVAAQVVIGAYVVWTGLNPWSNMVHFLVSAVLVVLSTSLVRHCGDSDARVEPTPAIRRTALVYAVGSSIAIVTGTFVTGSGPHAGDEDAIRLGFDIPQVVRIHSVTVWITLAALILLARSVRRSAQEPLYGAVSTTIGILLAQGFVGYVQYFADIPAALVALHIAGSIAVTIVSTNLVSRCLGFGGRARA